MLNVFKRMFKLAQSEAHSAIDKIQDPIKMTEQGIRDLRKDLGSSLKSLAETKAIMIRTRGEVEQKKQIAADYEKKAMLLLQKGQSGGLDAADADRLASEALSKKEQSMSMALSLSKDLDNQEKMVMQLEASINKLKSQVNSWENELTTLKSRAKIARASKKINQHMARVDSNSTISMLEKMKTKVSEDEALA
ncbi:MAG: PspA/IM30 family protein, partial [Nitrospinota bacterium]